MYDTGPIRHHGSSTHQGPEVVLTRNRYAHDITDIAAEEEKAERLEKEHWMRAVSHQPSAISPKP